MDFAEPVDVGCDGHSEDSFEAPRLLANPLRSRADRQGSLIAVLNEVASTVSSDRSVEEVLNTIVDSAKLITNTEKAVLVLTDDRSEEIDLDTLVVRGARTEHPQEVWEARLAGIAARAFAHSETVLDLDPSSDLRMLASPVKIREHPIGLICAINSKGRRFSRDQVDFLGILSAFAASAIHNAQLAERSRYVLLSSERDRIAREMHDGIAQSLFSISLALETSRKLAVRDPGAVPGRLAEIQEQLLEARTELRRFIYDLRPMKLSELGLAGAIDYWIREVTFGKDVVGNLDVVGTPVTLSPSQEFCLYRVAKEAVANVVRHARAQSFEVYLGYHDEIVVLTVSDDGCGFDVSQALAGGTAGLGLRSIRQRVAREGGHIDVESNQAGGTTVTVRMAAGGA